MAKVYDPKSKSYIDVSPEEATAGISENTFYAVKGDVPVVRPDGKTEFIKSKHAQEAFKSGWRYASDDEMRAGAESEFQAGVQASKEARFGDTTGELATAATSALGSVTGGLSDLLLPSNTQAALKTAREVNPTADVVGEVAGYLAPGGLGAKAGALGSKVGAKLSAAGLDALAKKGTIASIAAKAVEKAAAGAVEGAAIGAGQGVSEIALGDPEKAVEHVITGGQYGAIFGGLLGSVPALYKARPEFLKSAETAITDSAKKMTGYAASKIFQNAESRKAAAQMANMSDEAWAMTKSQIDEELSAAKSAIKAAKGAEKEAVKEAYNAKYAEYQKILKDRSTLKSQIKAETDYLKSTLKDVSTQTASTLKSHLDETGDLLEANRSIYRQSQESYKAAKTLLDDVYQAEPAALGPKINTTLSDQIQALSDSNPLKGPLSERLATVPTTVGDEFMLLADIKRQVGQEMRRGTSTTKDYKTLKAINETAAGMVASHPVSDVAELFVTADKYYKASNEVSKALGRSPKSGANVFPGEKKAYKALIQNPELEDTLKTIMDNAPELAPQLKAFADTAKNLKAQNAVLTEIQKKILQYKGHSADHSIDSLRDVLNTIKPDKQILDRADALKDMQARLASMGDIPAPDRLAIAAEVIGNRGAAEIPKISQAAQDAQIIKHYQGMQNVDGFGPIKMAAYTVGGPVGKMVAAASDLAQFRNNPYLQAQAIRAIKKTADFGRRTLENSVDLAVKAIKSAPAKAIAIDNWSRSKISDQRENYQKDVELVNRAADPIQMQEDLSQKMQYLNDSPDFKVAMGAQMVKTAQFLQSKMPVDPFEGQRMPGDRPFTPSDSQLGSFYRYVRAAEQPVSIVKSLADGTLTKEQVETGDILYPNLMADIRLKVTAGISDAKTPLSYRHKIALGVLLGLPTDPSLQGNYFLNLQGNYSPEQKDKGGRPPKSSKAPNVADSTLTLTQKSLLRK